MLGKWQLVKYHVGINSIIIIRLSILRSICHIRLQKSEIIFKKNTTVTSSKERNLISREQENHSISWANTVDSDLKVGAAEEGIPSCQSGVIRLTTDAQIACSMERQFCLSWYTCGDENDTE